SAQTTGAVIGVFNAGNRNGAASQNGAFIQATGTQSATYIQVSSLGAVSPGDPRVTPQGQATGGSGGSQTLPTPGTGTGGSLGPAPAVVGPSLGLRSGSAGQGVEAGDSTARAPAQQGGVGVTPADGLPYEEYYYGPPAKEEPVQRNAGGGVAQAWLQHQDVVGQPQQRAATTSNTGATVNTFGAANTFGWTRGLVTGNLTAIGTQSAAARLKAGAFGTGASTISANIVAVTPLNFTAPLQLKVYTAPLQPVARSS
ncbi:uncharacterized protein HaLaN_25303, partial [Haematococcus lacustris]